MKNLVYQQIDEVLAGSTERTGLISENALRVGAATVANSTEITATTVVCNPGGDDVDALDALVAEIADEYSLEAQVRQVCGSYSARFSRLQMAPPQVGGRPALKEKLAHILGR